MHETRRIKDGDQSEEAYLQGLARAWADREGPSGQLAAYVLVLLERINELKIEAKYDSEFYS